MNKINVKLGETSIEYNVAQTGTAFHAMTNNAIMEILEDARLSQRKTRVKLYYGEIDNGRDWGETHGIMGYVGRSTGTVKIPILISKKNSSGGGAILDHCIVKIDIKKDGEITGLF